MQTHRLALSTLSVLSLAKPNPIPGFGFEALSHQVKLVKLIVSLTTTTQECRAEWPTGEIGIRPYAYSISSYVDILFTEKSKFRKVGTNSV